MAFSLFFLICTFLIPNLGGGGAIKPETSIQRLSKIGSKKRIPNIPVLCYHQIRDWKDTDSKLSRTFIVPTERFAEQIKLLHERGYNAILPDQLVMAADDGAIPEKSVMITFDDGSASQFENALKPLDKYGFKAVFFIMTVTLGQPGYLTRQQVKMIADRGHQIGCHTWDHHKVTEYTASDWNVQLSKPTHLLEQITGRPIRYFAYPYGVWNREAINQLRAHGYMAAFQLNGQLERNDSEFKIPRILVDGNWNSKMFHTMIRKHSN